MNAFQLYVIHRVRYFILHTTTNKSCDGHFGITVKSGQRATAIGLLVTNFISAESKYLFGP